MTHIHRTTQRRAAASAPPARHAQSATRSRLTQGVALTVVLVFAAPFTVADEPSLDDLLDLTPTSAPTEPGDAADPAPRQPQTLVDDSTREALEGEATSGELLEQASDAMGDVSMRLGRSFDPGLETQREQTSILDKIDQLISMARKQQSQGGGGGGSGGESSQSRPSDSGGQQLADQNTPAGANQGSQTGKPGGGGGENVGGASPGSVGEVAPDEASIEETAREWGNLPPRLREELTEGLREPFSPVYRKMTEAYYQRLAEMGEDENE